MENPTSETSLKRHSDPFLLPESGIRDPQFEHPQNPTAQSGAPSTLIPDDLSQPNASSVYPNQVQQCGPYQGRSILVGKGVSSDYLLKKGASMIKSLTGADWFETEQKYGGKFGIRGTFCVIITDNSRRPIDINGDASAWRRRLVCYESSRKTFKQEEPGDESVKPEPMDAQPAGA